MIEILGKQTMSSREIAEITGKQHGHVIRDCDELNRNYLKMNEPPILDSREKVKIPNGGSKEIRVMLLTKMQTFDLMTGYNTELRIKVNRRWAELESKQSQELPQTFAQALQLAADQAKLLEKQAPKVESYERFIEADSLQGFKEVANMLGFGRNTFMKHLRNDGILTSKNIPYQKYLDRGYFEVKESTQNDFNVSVTYVTPKGIQFLEKKYK